MALIYGIKQCDSMKKAFAWLDAQAIQYQFIDYKKTPPAHEQLTAWSARLGWRNLINTQGTTWRRLPDSERRDLTEESAIRLMRDFPSLIKRPLIEHNNQILIGFDSEAFSSLFRSTNQ